MNKSFRSIWNASKQAYVAAAENVSACGKPSASSQATLALSAVLSGLLSMSAHAQNAPPPSALPTGAQVSAGQASIQSNGAAMRIQQSTDRAAINWQTFNVGSNAQVQFQQPSSNSVTLNRVMSADPSQIFGRITANGQVILTNPSGVYFSPSARVDVGGLVATTHSITDANFMAGNHRFERNGSTASVVNEGELKANLGGYIALLAPEVRNQGAIIAQAGTVALASGEAVDLHFDSNNRLTSIRVEASQIQALVDNRLAVQAPGGLVIISAQSMDRLVGGVIKNSGTLEATGLQQVDGRIVLSASKRVENNGTLNVSNTQGQGGRVSVQAEHIALQAGSRIDATGANGGGTVLVGGNWQGSADPLLEATGQPNQQATTVSMANGATINASATHNGDGGKVVLWSDVKTDNSTTDFAGQIQARGGANGGQGGQVETSGHALYVAGTARVDTTAPKGATGQWLLDPIDFTISAGTGAQSTSGIGADTLVTNLGTSSVTIATDATTAGNGDIFINANIASTSANSLTLKAHRHITQAAGVSVSTQGGALTYWADSDDNQSGSIIFSGATGTATLSTNGGNITLAGGADSGSGAPAGYAFQISTTTGGALTLNTGGGNLLIKSKTNSNFYAMLFADTVSFDAGTGSITIDAQQTGTVRGLTFNGVTTITSAKNSGTAISISGTSAASYGLVFETTGTGAVSKLMQIKSTGAGAIAITSMGTSPLYLDNLRVLAASGDITIDAGTAGMVIETNTTATTVIGQQTGLLASSTSNINLITDTLSPSTNASLTLATSGLVSIKPSSASFSALIDTTRVTFGSSISGLTLGQSGNTGALTLGSAISIPGPITLTGGAIAISANLTSSATTGSGISLTGTKITHNAGYSVITEGTPISYTVTNSPQTSVSDFALDLSGLVASPVTLNAKGGNINLNSAFASSGIDSPANTDAAIRTIYANLLTTGSGSITLTGNASNAISTSIVYGVSLQNSRIQSGSGGITLNGYSTNTYTGSRAIYSFNSNRLLAPSGNITLKDQTTGGMATGIEHRGNAADYLYLGADGTNVVTSSADITLQSNAITVYNGPIAYNTAGAVVIESLGASFTTAFSTWNAPMTFAGSPSSVRLGRTTNTSAITIGTSTGGGSITAAGPISVYGGAITLNTGLTATGNNTITLSATGTVTEGTYGFVSASNLALLGGNVTLTNASNAIGTVAAIGVSSFTYADSDALTIGTVGATAGIAATGAISVSTLTGDLTLGANVTTTTTTSSALLLNAGKSAAVGTATGGNLLISGAPTLSVGTGGTMKLMTGSVANSTGLTSLVGSGTGRFRYNADETTNFALASWTNLGTGMYAIYREQPTATPDNLNQVITYGDSFALSTTATGLVNGDTLSQSLVSPLYSSGRLNAKVTPYSISNNLTKLGYNVTANTLTVNPKVLTASGLSSIDKVYDGTTLATVIGTAALQAAAATPTSSDGKPFTGDTVSLSGTAVGNFNTKDVLTANTVAFTGLTLTGAQAGNYTLTQPGNDTTARITAKALTVTGVSSSDKVYDGTTAAVVNGTAALQATIAAGTGASTDGKAYTGDAVSLSGTVVGNFNSKDVATANTVTFAGLSLTGADMGNYTLTPLANDTTARITAKALTVSGLSSADKVYDGTTVAVVNGTAALQAAIAAGTGASTDGKAYTGDTVGLSGVVAGNFNSKDVATANAVAFTGLSLTGADAGNYTLTQPAAATNQITRAPLTIYANNDAKFVTTADPSFTVSYSPFVAGESATTAGVLTSTPTVTVDRTSTLNITNGSVATGVLANSGAEAAGTYANALVPSGAVAGNYQITYVKGNYTVVGAENLLVRMQSASAVYGAVPSYTLISAQYLPAGSNTPVTIGNVNLTGNAVSVNDGAGTTAAFNLTPLNATLSTTQNTSVGAYQLGATGINILPFVNPNFNRLTVVGDLSISPKVLTPNANNATKTYDGNTSTAGIPIGLTGLVTSGALVDAVVPTGVGVFASRNVGATTYTVSNLGLTGSDASNYSVSNAPISGSGTITRLSSVTWVGGSSGNWFDPANWAGGAVPDLSNVANVVIPAGTNVTFGNSVVAPAQSGPVNIDSLGGANGALTQLAGTLNVGSGGVTLSSYTQSGGTLTSAGAIALGSLTQTGGSLSTLNNFTVTQSFSQGTSGSITVGGNTSITDTTGGLVLGNLNTTGTTDIVSTGGDITQAAGTTIVSGGAATLVASNGGLPANITLDSATNDFMAAVSASGADVLLTDANALTLGTVKATGNLSLTSTGALDLGTSTVGGNLTANSNNGAITQTGALSVVGTSDLNAGSGNITLANSANRLQGAVTSNGAVVQLVNGTGANAAGDEGAKTQSALPVMLLPAIVLRDTTPPKPLAMDNSVSASASTSASASAVKMSSATASTAVAVSGNSVGVTVDLQAPPASSSAVLMMAVVSLPKGTSTVGTGFSFELPDAVRNLAAENSEIQISLPNGAPLPTWLSFDAKALRFQANAVPSGAFPFELVLTLGGQRVLVAISERAD